MSSEKKYPNGKSFFLTRKLLFSNTEDMSANYPYRSIYSQRNNVYLQAWKQKK